MTWTTWLAVGIILFFLVPLALSFAAEAYRKFQDARLDKEIREYVKYCQKNGIALDEGLVQIVLSPSSKD